MTVPVEVVLLGTGSPLPSAVRCGAGQVVTAAAPARCSTAAGGRPAPAEGADLFVCEPAGGRPVIDTHATACDTRSRCVIDRPGHQLP
jgi:hypothetical protein